jgi:hypothetical protein
MGYRLSWLGGIAGIGLALLRMDRLLRPSVEGLPWELVLVAAALLGAAITWAMVSYGLNVAALIGVNLVALTLTVFRITVPDTTWFIFPTTASLDAIGAELEWAATTIRSAVPPVLPLAGVVAIAAVVFWALGALLVWGLLRNRPYAAVLPPLVVYLQFATMDRVPSGYWSWAFLLVLGCVLAAVAADRRHLDTGVLTVEGRHTAVTRSLPSAALLTVAVTFAFAMVATNGAAGLVPSSGLLEWRVNSGLSGGYLGSVSYNPFVGVQQRLLSQTDAPVFIAEIDGDADPGRLYWRMVALDSFGGGQWYLADDAEIRSPSELTSYEDEDVAFKGPVQTVDSTITILGLQQEWLPAIYAPQELRSPNRAVEQGVRIKIDDGSIWFDALSYYGMNYEVVSAVPDPDLDVLSRTAEGFLSPVFAAAAEAGDYPIDATGLRVGGDDARRVVESDPPRPPPSYTLEARTRFLQLPADEQLASVAQLASTQTRGLATDYERALALEAFFRSSGRFEYSTDVAPGHGATALAAWLLDPASPNYRRGYCEQFATAMAVMARQIGIPSRVVLGFTPGAPTTDGRVLVRDRNAHAWVELWMDAQGWVQFDPTPRGDGVNPSAAAGLGFPVDAYLDAASGESALPGPGSLPTPNTSPIPRDLELPPPVGIAPGERPIPIPDIPAWVIVVAGGAAALLVAVPAAKAIRRRRRLRRLRGGDIAAAWIEAVDRLTDLGAGPGPADTPTEFAAAVDGALLPLAEAHGAVLYGPPSAASARTRWADTAADSLRATEAHIARRYPLRRRLAAGYRVGSLLPRRLRDRRR